MKFRDRIEVGAKGGHGPIRYSVEKYNPNEIFQFRFSKSDGFNGIHKFEIYGLVVNQTEIIHTIEIQTVGKGTLIWLKAICSLHNGCIEDALYKVENRFSTSKNRQNGIFG